MCIRMFDSDRLRHSVRKSLFQGVKKIREQDQTGQDSLVLSGWRYYRLAALQFSNHVNLD